MAYNPGTRQRLCRTRSFAGASRGAVMTSWKEYFIATGSSCALWCCGDEQEIYSDSSDPQCSTHNILFLHDDFWPQAQPLLISRSLWASFPWPRALPDFILASSSALTVFKSFLCSSVSWLQVQIFLTPASALCGSALPEHKINSFWPQDLLFLNPTLVLCGVVLTPSLAFPDPKLSSPWPRVKHFLTPSSAFPGLRLFLKIKDNSLLHQHQLFVTQSSEHPDPKLRPSWTQTQAHNDHGMSSTYLQTKLFVTSSWVLPNLKLFLTSSSSFSLHDLHNFLWPQTIPNEAQHFLTSNFLTSTQSQAFSNCGLLVLRGKNSSSIVWDRCSWVGLLLKCY